MRSIDIAAARTSSELNGRHSKRALLASTAIGFAVLLQSQAHAAGPICPAPNPASTVDAVSCGPGVSTTPEVVVLNGTLISLFALQGPSSIDTTGTAGSTALSVDTAALLNVVTLNSPSVIKGDVRGVGVTLSGSGGLTVTNNAVIVAADTGIEIERINGGVNGDIVFTNNAKISIPSGGSGSGIKVSGNGTSGNVTINNYGVIDPPLHGIELGPLPGDAITNNFADVTGDETGIFHHDLGGDSVVNLFSGDVGALNTDANGITVENVDGDVSITSLAGADVFSLASGGDGVVVRNNVGGSVRMDLAGKVDAADFGIFIENAGGDVTIDARGNVTTGASGKEAIFVGENTPGQIVGSATVRTFGNVTGGKAAGRDAIDVAATGDVTIETAAGKLVSGATGFGIRANSLANVTVKSSSNINAGGGLNLTGVKVDADVDGDVVAATENAMTVVASDEFKLRGSADLTASATGKSGVDVALGGDGGADINYDGDITANQNGIKIVRTGGPGGAGGNINIVMDGKISVASTTGGSSAILVDNSTAQKTGNVKVVMNGAIDPPQFGVNLINTIGSADSETGVVDAIEQGVRIVNTQGTVGVLAKGAITTTFVGADTFGINVTNTANTASTVNIETLLGGSITNTAVNNSAVGINVAATGPGVITTTTIKQGGVINVGGDGIRTRGIAGAQTVDSLANVTSALGDAIDVAGLGKVNVNTKSGTTLTGFGDSGTAIKVLTGGGAAIDSGANLSAYNGIEVTTQAGGAGGLIDINQRGAIDTAPPGAGTNYGIRVSNAATRPGAVNVKQSGAISNPSVGISVESAQGDVDIQSTASINAVRNGIRTDGAAANVNILATKNITVTGAATFAAQAGIFSGGTVGKVTIETLLGSTIDTSAGSGQAGIAVTNVGGPAGVGDVNIRQGGVVKANSTGIVVDTRQGPVTVDSLNDVTAGSGDAIAVFRVNGAVRINTADGKTLTAGDDGIYVQDSGPTTIKSRAKINAGTDGIETTGITGNQEIESFEDINATNGDAIRAGGTGAVKILTALNKKLDAGDDGIRVTAATTVEIDSGSKIEATDDGIVTRGATGAQDIRVRDDITTTNGDGVDARGAGKITINQFAGAVIVAGDDGISAESTANGIDITQDETIGAGGDGIVADAADGFANKVLSKKAITSGGDGIFAQDGAIDIETQALIDAGDDGIETNSGDSVKIVQKAKVDAADDAIRVRNTTGNVDVSSQQELIAADDGVRVHSTGGNVIVTTNSAAKITAQDDGIEVTSTTGTTNITVNAKIDATDRGVRVANNTGTVTVNLNAEVDPIVGFEAINNAADVIVNQNGFDVIASQDGYLIDQTGGKVDLNIDGAIKGPNANGSGLTDGIDIEDTTGNVEIDTTAKGAILASADGINIDRTTANVIINTGAAIGTALLPTTRAIVVDNTDGNNTLTLDGTINATSKGVLIRDTANNAVQTNNTTVTLKKALGVTAGDGIDVDYASQKSTGNTTVTTEANGTINTPGGIGIRVNNSGDTAGDEVEINQAGTITAENGIVVDESTGLVDVNANNAITAAGGVTSSAIRVTDTTGDVTVDTNGAGFLTSDGIGVEVRRTSNDATVTTNAQIDSNTIAIIVDATGRDATVTQNGAIDSVAGAEANVGIYVRNTGRDAVVNQNALINANTVGIRVQDDTNNGVQTRNTTVATTAAINIASGDGIDVDFSAQESSGNTTVTTGGVITATNGIGIRVLNSGDSAGDTVQVNQNQDVFATTGIFIDDTFGAVDVNSNDPITASIDGIHVEDTTGNVTVDTDGTATINANDDGIEVLRTTGTVAVTTNAAIDSVDRGILVSGANGVTITQNAKIDPVVGIEVLDDLGNTLINSNALIVATQDGIRVADGPDGDALGTIGTTTVVSTGQIQAGDDAVDAFGVGRIIANLNANGVLTTTAGDFVVDADSTGADVFVNISRSVVGDADDNGSGGVVDVDSITGSTVNFNSGLSWSNNDRLVDAKGGAASVFVANAATAKGFVNLTANADLLTVQGNWYAVGEFTPTNPTDSEFGGGSDVVSIEGGRIWTAVDFFNAETVRFLNLETLNSDNGEIFMVDGAVDDLLIARNAAYTGSNAAALSFDILLGGTGSTSDELRVNSTSGVTDLYVNDRNFGPGAYNPDGIIVVRTAAGNSAADHFRTENYSGNGTFDPVTGVIDKGLFFYDLFFRPNTTQDVAEFGTEDQHLYAGLPDGEVFQLASIPLQLQNHFHAQAGDWLSRNVDLRDENAPAGKNWNFWAKAYGSWQDREQTQSFSFLNKSFAFDVSYDQNNAGMMAGFGYTDQLSGGGKLRSGIFGGYTEFDSEFVSLKGSTARTTVDADGYSLGAYLSYTEPSWYLDSFFKADFLNVDISIPTLADFPPASAGPSANNYGAALEGGYQHAIARNLDGVVFAGLTYVQSRLDNVELSGATVDFSSNSSLRGRLGVGIDTVLSDDKASRFSGGVSLAVVHEFMGENDIRVFSAGPLLNVTDEFDETLAQVSARLEYTDLEGGLTAFVKGDYEFNGDYEDVRISAGLRLPFQAPK